MHSKLLYVESFQVCLSDFDAKDPKLLKHMHSLIPVTQTACSLILLILLSKYLSYDLKIQLVSLLCHIHIQCVVSMTVGGQ